MKKIAIIVSILIGVPIILCILYFGYLFYAFSGSGYRMEIKIYSQHVPEGFKNEFMEIAGDRFGFGFSQPWTCDPDEIKCPTTSASILFDNHGLFDSLLRREGNKIKPAIDDLVRKYNLDAKVDFGTRGW